MIDKRHIPLIVFVACVVLGLVLAALTGAWPTALAIALAGCALGLAMRPPEVENHDTAFLEEDIADIRALTERQSEDIAVLRTSVDEMAEIVESIAMDIQRLPKAPDPEEIATLRSAIDLTGRRVTALDGPREQITARLDTLDREVATLHAGQARVAMQDDEVVELESVEPVALAATGNAPRMRVGAGGGSVVNAGGGGGSHGNSSGSGNSGGSGAAVSLVDRAEHLRERFPRARMPRKVRATPLFDNAGNPASLMIDDPAEKTSIEGTVAALRHALSLIEASEEPRSRVFVRLAPGALTDPALSDAIGPVLEEAGASIGRLVAVVHQASIKDGPPPALALLTDSGARFGLERMADWSADLDALAAGGLALITVDGPAMAKSAMAQKGDPTRLHDVLQTRGIDLLASEIDTRMQLDAVNSLVPDLLCGPGLGEATLVDVPA